MREAIKRFETPVHDLIRGRLKRSKSYLSQYENKTLEQLIRAAKTSKEAKRMLKLIKDEPRLLEKISAWIAALLACEDK